MSYSFEANEKKRIENRQKRLENLRIQLKRVLEDPLRCDKLARFLIDPSFLEKFK